MAYKVIDTDAFRFEYDTTLLYLVDVLEAHKAACVLADSLDVMRANLASTPFMHAISGKPALHMLGMREYALKDHVVLYRVEDTTVYLEHIFHTRQDYANQL